MISLLLALAGDLEVSCDSAVQAPAARASPRFTTGFGVPGEFGRDIAEKGDDMVV